MTRRPPGSKRTDTLLPNTTLCRAPFIESGGRMFPVDVRYSATSASSRSHGDDLAAGALRALTKTTGDILCFLPGAREIRAAHDHLAARLANDEIGRAHV